MNFNHLEIYIAVYREMNITKSAEQLHISQPAVTRCIRDLEREYGILLFERLGHRLYRTKAGDQFYADALHVLESVDRLSDNMQETRHSAVLRIGSSATIGTYYLSDLIHQFQLKYSSVDIHVEISNSIALQQSLLDNQLDLALIEEVISNDQLSTEKLRDDRMILIMPEDHPLVQRKKIYLKDLMQYPLLLREEGSAARNYLNHVFAVHELEPKPLWESVSTHAIINAVEKGIGISILPEEFVKEAVNTKHVASRMIKDESFQRNNHLVWHRSKNFTNAGSEFIQECRSYFSR